MVKGLGRRGARPLPHLRGPMRDMTRCPYCNREQKPAREERGECVYSKCMGYVVNVQGLGLVWTHQDVVPFDEAFDSRRPEVVEREFYTED